MTKTVASNDKMFLKYAKLEMVPDGLNAIHKFIQDNDDDENVELALATFLYETDDGYEIDDILKQLKKHTKKIQKN